MLNRLLKRSFSTAATAAKYRQHGVPAQVIKLEQETLADPAGSQVLIKMLAAPVNPSDINTIEGSYPIKPASLPAVAGGEGVGVVVSVGSGVKGLKVNDWVIPSQPAFGTWRTHALAEEAALTKVSNDLPVEYAATLAVNPCTAYRLLEDFVKLNAGDVIIQNGANSTVGQSVIQLAKARGVKTVNIIRDRPDYKQTVDTLKALGADIVVTEEIARSAEMSKLLSDLPKPVLALNTVGGASATELARLLGEKGTLVTYGGMSKQPVTLPTSALIFKEISVKGFWLSKWVSTHSKEERQAMINAVSELVISKKLKLALERKSFSELPSVLASSSGFKGRKTVLTF